MSILVVLKTKLIKLALPSVSKLSSTFVNAFWNIMEGWR